MINFLKPAPPAKQLVPNEDIRRVYRNRRIGVFTSIYIAYAAYYIVRYNFTLSEPYLMRYYHFDKATIGLILSCLAISYGLSKFIMGALADKCNPRYYIATGLIASALLNFGFGMTSNKYVMMILIIFMGIFQGMGAPAAHKTLSVWFSTKERGTFVSIWNTSHNIGGGIVPIIVGMALTIFGAQNWHSIFFLPSCISILLAVIVIVFGADTPESVGLPPIQVYHHEEEKHEVSTQGKHIPLMKIINECILKRPYIWVLAISNAAVYVIRYGVSNWIPIYLHTMKGFSLATARGCFSVYEFAAIPGTILIGIISDRIFKGKRSLLSAILVILLGGTFVAYWFSSSISAITVEIALMGILVYGPQMLITVLTIDLVPHFAVGGTDGFVGLFGYVFGQVIASYFIGKLVDAMGWSASFWIIFVAALVSLIGFVILMRAENTLDEQLKALCAKFNAEEA